MRTRNRTGRPEERGSGRAGGRHLLPALLFAVATGCSSTPPAGGEATADAESAECLLGRLDIVWNHEPRFFVTTDEPLEAEVLIGEALLREAGGPLGVNGKRVRVLGRWVTEDRRVLRADRVDVSPGNEVSCG